MHRTLMVASSFFHLKLHKSNQLSCKLINKSNELIWFFVMAGLTEGTYDTLSFRRSNNNATTGNKVK